MSAPGSLSLGRIGRFWMPLAGTWLMMALEGPFLAAVIARLVDPKPNLAAFGVAFAIAIIVESPVIMLLSASTALVKDRHTFLQLRRFTLALNAGVSLAMGIVLLPPVFDLLARHALRLPADVARLTHGALLLLVPWPAAIGDRRFHQGLLIAANRTRRVAYGTTVRLTAMATTALLAATRVEQGAYVGAAALCAGVLAEALATRLMARGVVRDFLRAAAGAGDAARAAAPVTSAPSTGGGFAAAADHVRPVQLSMGEIHRFYLPLALTSILTMAVQPMITFFMGQSRFALDSLAVLPVINGLTFVFRALGISFQEVGIALLGERGQHARPLQTFALLLACGATACLAWIAFTPLSTVWFAQVSGLSAELTAFSRLPTRIVTVLPALSVALAFQRAILVHGRRTAPLTWGTVAEVGSIGLGLFVAIHVLDWVGAVAATSALVLGRLAGNAYLVRPVRRQLRVYRASQASSSTVPWRSEEVAL